MDYEPDLKDPFNGGPKAVLVGFTYLLTLVPWMSTAPALFFLVLSYSQSYKWSSQSSYILDLRVIMGGFLLAGVKFGIVIAKIIPGFSSLLNKE
jgi:hypothetical protein